MPGAQRILIAAVGLGAAFGLGLSAGRGVQAPPRPSPVPCLQEIVEQLEDAAKSSDASVDILQKMAKGETSRDATSLTLLGDSMQELTETLGNVRSEVEAIRRAGRLADCSIPR